ncbi:response regulator [Thalassococcus sp. S3]|uniref:response regulator n=1 Tax=Thalassococcus sp. S3 TaxID=2017482 RepID=UPI0013EE4DC7|nr:response regulator [Thalassococcus sp. S3]
MPLAKNLALVLDDEWIIAEGLSTQLSSFGFEDVARFGSSKEALEFLAEIAPKQPDFAILDVSLSRGDNSLDVAIALHEKDIPFWFMTGYGRKNELSEKFADVETLTKPVFEQDLVRRLKGLWPD